MRINQECEDTIITRQTVRNFSDKRISFDVLQEILLAGSVAPNSSNLQAWRFVVISNDEIRDRISDFSPGAPSKPTGMIVICSDLDPISETLGQVGVDSLSLIDVGSAAENMILTAWKLNVGTCPVGSFDKALIKKMLDLPDQWRPDLILSFGYYDSLPPKPAKKPLQDLIMEIV